MSEHIEAVLVRDPSAGILARVPRECEEIVADICDRDWDRLGADELTNVAWIYYYFSVQFCETVGIARRLYPDDVQLAELDAGERNTDNLSPYPGVVDAGERLDHDEFMRRALGLTQIDGDRAARLRAVGEAYLAKARAVDDLARAGSLVSYEDGGLENVFRAIRRAQTWDSAVLRAFRHFLDGHIMLDSDPNAGHGSLCRHLVQTQDVVDLWKAFREAILAAAPSLSR